MTCSAVDRVLALIDPLLTYEVFTYSDPKFTSLVRKETPSHVDLLWLVEAGCVEMVSNGRKIKCFRRTCSEEEAIRRVRVLSERKMLDRLKSGEVEIVEKPGSLASPKTYFRETSESGCYKIFQHATMRCQGFARVVNPVTVYGPAAA